MEMENKTQPSESYKEAKLAMQQSPELLMAARKGDSARLNDLLGNDDATEVVVDIENIVTNERVPTFEPDSILHVVAASGDDAEFLKSASVIHSKAKNLLDAGNNKGDTPLHCAARAGRIKMVSHLIHLARGEGGGDARVKVVLRKENNQGETALHEALRLGNKNMVKEMVDSLMAADDHLARFPSANGTSPLYLAVLLGHDDIAELLYKKDKELSYSGPDGQNVLHVAVLRSEGMTKKLLVWDMNLSKRGDGHGSTPLHFAASCGFHKAVSLLINDDKCSAYQPDNKGSFPIHVAVMRNKADVVRVLLEKCPDCAELRDAQGRNFLHVAIYYQKDALFRFVFYLLGVSYQWWRFASLMWEYPAGDLFCFVLYLLGRSYQSRRFASLMDMQDNAGNTGLHLAVLGGRVLILYHLLWNKELQLNLPNNEGQTARDLSRSKMPTGVVYTLHPRDTIHNLLRAAGAKYGAHLEDPGPTLNEEEEAKKITDSTQTIGIVSALLVTVSFAAAFTIPGGYRSADDGHNGGTPVLAKSYSFETFIVANNLALLCSALATVSLMYAGMAIADIRTRMNFVIFSIFLLNGSARSLTAAFAFGMNAVLAPVARTAAIVTTVCAALALLDVGWFALSAASTDLVLLNRQGIPACLRFALRSVFISLVWLWPYVIIVGFLVYSKIHGIH